METSSTYEYEKYVDKNNLFTSKIKELGEQSIGPDCDVKDLIITELNKKIQKFETDITNEKKSNELKCNEIKKFKNKVANQKDDNRGKDRKIVKLRKVINTLEKKINEQKESNNSLNKKILELNKSIKKQTEQNDMKDQNVVELKKTIEHLNEEMKNMDSEGYKDKKIIELTKENKSLKEERMNDHVTDCKQIIELIEKNKALEKQNITLLKDNQILKEKILNQRNEIKSLNKKLVELARLKRKIKKENESQQNNVFTDSEIYDLKEKINNLAIKINNFYDPSTNTRILEQNKSSKK
uniref:Viral a-type inclusion protein n=1 Tax=Parastrongyloides trichosuri TaxID=131310 RepID=A0A0N4ZQU4_PARTI